jgi:hypothetical protein
MAPSGPPRPGRPTDTDPRRFVRVVEREGWDVELVAEGRSITCPTWDEAMRAALAAEPD